MNEKPSILDKGSYVPLYRQLFFTLLNDIKTGKWGNGERLPSERDLAIQYKVSRITARQAVEALVKAGVVYREQGKGTFVANYDFGHFSFNSFTSDTISRGKEPSSVVIEFDKKRADEIVEKKTKIPSGEDYYDIVRIRKANEKPVAIQHHNIIVRHCPHLTREELEQRSFFDILRNTYGIIPAWTEPKISVTFAGEFEKKLLEVDAGHALVSVESTTYTETFEIIEWVTTLYRSDGLMLYLGRQRIDGRI